MRGSSRVPIGAGLVLFAAQVIAILTPVRVPGEALISDFVPILIPLATTAACLLVARKAATDRAVWLLLGLGSFAWALGDIGFTIYGYLDIDPAGSFSLADIGYLLLIPAWAAALILHPSRSRRGIDRFGTMVDALVIVAVAATITVAYVLQPTIAAAHNVAGAVVLLAYPVGDLALLVVLATIRARSSDRMAVGDLMIFGAAAVFAVGDIVFARLAAIDAYSVGNPVDLAWSAAFVLIAVAAGRALTTKDQETEERAMVPILAVIGISGMVGLSALAAWTRLGNRTILAGAALTGLLLVVRLVLLLADRGRLLDAYDAKVVELREADAARERFIATVSHDLRSPLASISGFAQLIRMPDVLIDHEKVIDMTMSIERNSRRLARMTEDLLCAGQFATGHPPPLQLQAVDLFGLAVEAIDDMGRADRVHVIGEKYIYAMADKQRVVQIIVNLIENAFKHSGSADVTIHVQTTLDGPALEVSDHGVGIEPERVAKIFDPFVSDYKSSNSVGLGLYVVRNLVSAMNGRVSVTSEVDVGTTFRVILPPAIVETTLTDDPEHVATSAD